MKQRTVVITRPDGATFVDAVRALGFQVLYLPVFTLVELPLSKEAINTLSNLAEYCWIIFTSRHGVGFFPQQYVDAIPLGVKVAAIGEKTAAAVQERFGREPAFIGRGDSSEQFAEKLLPLCKTGDKLLLVTPQTHRQVISQRMQEVGISCNSVAVYQQKEIPPSASLLAQLAAVPQEQLVWPFFSPSAVRRTLEVITNAREMLTRGYVLSIGAVTSREIQNHGIRLDYEAEAHTQEGVVRHLKELQSAKE